MIEVEYYSAVWCGPCKAMKIVVENLKAKGWNITKIDVDQEKDRASAANIMAVPTMIIKKDGVPVRRIQGARQEMALEAEFRLAQGS